MFYESQYRQLLRLRSEYWRQTSPSSRNLKLSQMILCADACGKDLIEFILEAKGEMEEVNASKKANNDSQVFDNQIIESFAKAKKAEAKSKNDFAFVPKKYRCAFCSFTTESLKSLNGHQKRHSSKYQPLNIAV